jgi:hypothetical protein
VPITAGEELFYWRKADRLDPHQVNGRHNAILLTAGEKNAAPHKYYGRAIAYFETLA